MGNVLVAVFFIPLKDPILNIATNDTDVLGIARKVVPAMLIGTYLNLQVGNITSGVFSGMGRPIIATILSFGFELPMSIGGVAVFIILAVSDWDYWTQQARKRQQLPSSTTSTNDD